MERKLQCLVIVVGTKEKKKHEWEVSLSCFPFWPDLCYKRASFLAKTVNNKSVYLFSDDVLITESLFKYGSQNLKQ